MKYTWLFLFLLPFFSEEFLQAQPNAIPAPPLYLVTVDPETGYDSIVWIDPRSPLIDYFAVSVYSDESSVPTYKAIAMGITDTFFVNKNPESWRQPVGYSSWGIHVATPPQWSGIESTDSTMFLQAVFDSCKATISLRWNDYNNWRGKNTGITIFRRMGYKNYVPLATVPPNTLNYVLNNVASNQNYELFIEEQHIDGIRKSNSNRVDLYTRMTPITGTINADYATISANNTIDLSFTARGTTGIHRYDLVWGRDTNSINQRIVSVVTSDTILHFNHDVPFTSGIYLYRLELYNNCDSPFATSNLANNIVLRASATGTNVALVWNPYYDWEGGVDHYRVIRTTGSSEGISDTLDAGALRFYTDNVATLIDYVNPASSQICYQIDALQGTNKYGIQENSLSNIVCVTIIPDVRVPDAFIPNDGDAVNRVFEPVFSFMPEHYEITIFNRLGTLVWEGSGPWDGTSGGKPVPEGVYIYQLRIYNYSSDKREINGRVVVVYR